MNLRLIYINSNRCNFSIMITIFRQNFARVYLIQKSIIIILSNLIIICKASRSIILIITSTNKTNRSRDFRIIIIITIANSLIIIIRLIKVNILTIRSVNLRFMSNITKRLIIPFKFAYRTRYLFILKIKIICVIPFINDSKL